MSLRHAQRAYVLENGKAVLEGEAAELRQRDDIKAFYLGLAPEQATRPELALAELTPRRPRPHHRDRGANMSVQRKIESIAEGVPALPRPREPAHIIRSDAEAIAVAHGLAAEFAKGASERDRDAAPAGGRARRLLAERPVVDQRAAPRSAGPSVSYVTLARVIAIISAADPSHRADPAEPSRRRRGHPHRRRRGAAGAAVRPRCCAASGSATPSPSSAASAPPSSRPRFTDHGDHVLVTGRKFYSTGALLAHLVPIVAVDDEGARLVRDRRSGRAGPDRDRRLVELRPAHHRQRHRAARPGQGAQDPSGAGLQGL